MSGYMSPRTYRGKIVVKKDAMVFGGKYFAKIRKLPDETTGSLVGNTLFMNVVKLKDGETVEVFPDDCTQADK